MEFIEKPLVFSFSAWGGAFGRPSPFLYFLSQFLELRGSDAKFGVQQRGNGRVVQLTISYALGDVGGYVAQRTGEVVPDQSESAREKLTVFGTIGGCFLLLRLLKSIC